MSIPVRIVLSRRNLVAPVYLAGTFTEWQPSLVMDMVTKSDDTDVWNEFQKVVDLEPGTHLYKFRLGKGEWWITDDATEQVTDEQGNVNNIITVDGLEDALELKPIDEENSSRHFTPSPRCSSRQGPASDSADSSNVTIAETSTLLNSNSVKRRNQNGAHQLMDAQSHDKSSVNGSLASKNPSHEMTTSSKSTENTSKPSGLSSLLSFCSRHRTLSVVSCSALVLAVFMAHSHS